MLPCTFLTCLFPRKLHCWLFYWFFLHFFHSRERCTKWYFSPLIRCILWLQNESTLRVNAVRKMSGNDILRSEQWNCLSREIMEVNLIPHNQLSYVDLHTRIARKAFVNTRTRTNCNARLVRWNVLLSVFAGNERVLFLLLLVVSSISLGG